LTCFGKGLSKLTWLISFVQSKQLIVVVHEASICYKLHNTLLGLSPHHILNGLHARQIKNVHVVNLVANLEFYFEVAKYVMIFFEGDLVANQFPKCYHFRAEGP
jgi:hypothetical protein